MSKGLSVLGVMKWIPGLDLVALNIEKWGAETKIARIDGIARRADSAYKESCWNLHNHQKDHRNIQAGHGQHVGTPESLRSPMQLEFIVKDLESFVTRYRTASHGRGFMRGNFPDELSSESNLSLASLRRFIDNDTEALSVESVGELQDLLQKLGRNARQFKYAEENKKDSLELQISRRRIVFVALVIAGSVALCSSSY